MNEDLLTERKKEERNKDILTDERLKYALRAIDFWVVVAWVVV